MAAAGTGLPAQRGQVASTITDTGAYGAAEQARAEGFAIAAQGLDKLMRRMEPAANEAAKRQGEQAAAAGEFRQRMLITGADAAYNDAVTAGTLARLGNQRDADLDELRIKHAFDPEGYQAAALEYRTAALNSAVPSQLAIDWANDFDARNTRILSTIRGARAERDIQEARADLVTQSTRLIDEAITTLPGAPVEAAWESGEIQSALERVNANIAVLESNPAYGVSPEEADAMRRDAATKLKVGAARAYAIGVLRDQGSDAALNIVQEFATASEVFETAAERDLVVASVRAAVNDELSLANQRRNQAEAERSARETAMNRLIEEDVGSYLLTGEGTSLTAEQVREVHGDAGVVRWLTQRSRAAEERRLFDGLPLNDPDAAAEEIARRAAAQPLASIGMIGDADDLNSVAAAIAMVESGNRDGLTSADPDGAGPAGGGAMGRMQLLPETAQRMAAKLGLPYDENRLRNDGAYNQQLGRAYLTELIDRYQGDTFLAITAYHAGEGNVDGWLRSVGDPRTGQITREAWLDGVEARGNPRSAAYPRKVLAALNGGRAAAAWDSYRQINDTARADPGSHVAAQPDVRNALASFNAVVRSGSFGGLADAGEAYVEANLAAQERAGIPPSQRRALPNQTLLGWAGYLQRNEADPATFDAAQETIIDTFGEAAGARVIRDALIMRGNTQFSAQVAAAAARARFEGRPPPPPSQVRAAQRVERVTQAASGTRAVSQMTDEELRRAAGFQ